MVSNIMEPLELDGLALEGSGENEDLSHLCLTGKVLASKPLNRNAVTTIIHNVWRTQCELSISPWTENAFLFQFTDEEDHHKILRDSPWSVMGFLLALQPLIAEQTMEETDSSGASFGFKPMAYPLTSSPSNMVEIDTTKPLPREGNDIWISYKFEKLSDFCYACGRLGHDSNGCKFVSKEAGDQSGYGLDLRTGTTQPTFLPVEHYR
ncbi:hypothetical protein ACSBR2_025478 [Camellia fascicularis]